MREIILNTVNAKSSNYKKYVALVDDEDFERVNQYNWSIKAQGHTIYAQRRYGDKTQTLHNFVMNDSGIDHIDHNGLNCQKGNLRKATPYQNSMNTLPKRNSTSRFKGVCWAKDMAKWKCQIQANYKKEYLGYFDSEETAAQVYNNRAKELFGEYAHLNPIP